MKRIAMQLNSSLLTVWNEGNMEGSKGFEKEGGWRSNIDAHVQALPAWQSTLPTQTLNPETPHPFTKFSAFLTPYRRICCRCTWRITASGCERPASRPHLQQPANFFFWGGSHSGRVHGGGWCRQQCQRDTSAAGGGRVHGRGPQRENLHGV
jgi:hypothetical protein